MRGAWHHQDRRRRGPRELTGIVDLTRGKEHPTARLLDLVPGRSGTVYKNWLAERGEDFRAGVRIAALDPPSNTNDPKRPGQQPHKQTVNNLHTDPVNKNDSMRPSRQVTRTMSVEVAYHCAQHVRDVFHQAAPAHGRRLAARLVERLPTCPIPDIARLGRTLRKWKDAFLAYFDTAGASNGPTEAINGHYRTKQTHHQRPPQPHQLPAPNAPHHRRPRYLHPHPTLKSPFT